MSTEQFVQGVPWAKLYLCAAAGLLEKYGLVRLGQCTPGAMIYGLAGKAGWTLELRNAACHAALDKIPVMVTYLQVPLLGAEDLLPYPKYNKNEEIKFTLDRSLRERTGRVVHTKFVDGEVRYIISDGHQFELREKEILGVA